MNIYLTLAHDGAQYVECTPERLAELGVEPSVVLSAVKSFLSKAIDDRAEALRLTLITPGSGQAMEYQEAYSQAVAALADPAKATAARFPMLAVTVGSEIDPQTGAPAVDVLGVARSVAAGYDAYLVAGAAIRGVRLNGKVKVGQAASVADAEAAFAAIDWTLSA